MTRRLCLLALLCACLLAAQERPYVVLVSLDGFRYDYADLHGAPNLKTLAKAGASAEMIPSFPSVTFPNHTTLVTGDYPDHHGIVANRFFDTARQQEYSTHDAPNEGSWLQAKPLWVLAEEQHVKSATMFWPMSDAEIAGVRPSYWEQYNGRVPDEDRVAKVVGWLKLPERDRPHFLTLYFSDTDSAGHDFGPDAPETANAVHHVDTLIGTLWKQIQGLGLPVNLIVVADHGMQKVSGSVNLSDYTDLSRMKVVNGGPYALLYAPDAAAADRAYRELKGKNPKFDVYRRRETPPELHYSDNDRIGDLVAVARQPTLFAVAGERPMKEEGAHGYDPRQFRTMHAIFYAAGPNIRAGVRLEPFENIDVAPFIAKILGLRMPAGIDGSAKPLEPALR
ncbi:MAG TPA: ectonucleotide pyrophosphatase/phosphodiesterase [Bryobacteraceae bacterium]|nr:ectonucleotide pyrophosphatase/phosphodiesterase [Bryobacteraceae bacterium]